MANDNWINFGVNAMDEKKVLAQIANLDKVARKAWNKAAKKIIPPAVARAKAQAPVKTGLLKRAITGKVTHYGNVRIFVNPRVFGAKVNGTMTRINLKGSSRKSSWKERSDQLGKLARPAKYAVPIEFGQKKKRTVRAKPFLLNAFDGRREEILRTVVDAFNMEMAKNAPKAD